MKQLKDMTFEERTAFLNSEQKAQFRNFCLSYFKSFGWTILNDAEDNLIAHDSLNVVYKILIVDSPRDTFPTMKELNTFPEENILIVSSEYSPRGQLKGSKKRKINQHTASGINFIYLTSTNGRK